MSSPPTRYIRQADFSAFSEDNPGDQQPGVSMDAEFDAIEAVADKTIDRLNEIQRGDGKLSNLSVHKDALNAEVLAMIATGTGTPRGNWLTTTAYVAKDLVSNGGNTYICVTPHTAGVFATDLAAGKWLLFALSQAVTLIADDMTSLRAISSAWANASPNAVLRSYAGDKSDGAFGFFWFDPTYTVADNGGTIIKPADIGSGSPGRWRRNVVGYAAYHAAWFGVKADGVTDNLTAMQALMDAAYNYGPNVVCLGSTKGSFIAASDTVDVHPGQEIEGCGPFNTEYRCTNATATTFAFRCRMPLGGDDDGTATQAPRWRKMTIRGRSGIQLNNPVDTFLDDGTSQKPLHGPLFEDVALICTNALTAGTIGIQLCKTAGGGSHGDVDITGFDIHLDLQGAEDVDFSNIRSTTCSKAAINAVRRNTFGNNLKIDHLFLGAGHNTCDAVIVSDYKTLNCARLWIEPQDPGPTNLVWLKETVSGNVTIRDVFVGAAGTQIVNTLKVDDTTDGGSGVGYESIVCENWKGGLLTGSHSAPNFNGGAGLTYFTGQVRRSIRHETMPDQSGAANWPYNSKDAVADLGFQEKTLAYFTPSLPGLLYAGYGLTVKCLNNAFLLALTGAGNYLEFGPGIYPQPRGPVDLEVLADNTSGGTLTGGISGQILDNGSAISDAAAVDVKAYPDWVTIKSNETITTASGTFRVFSNDSRVRLYAVRVRHH